MDNLQVLSAAREGDLEAISTFFEQENGASKFAQIKNEYSLATPLHMAAANDHTDVLEYMLKHLDESQCKQLVNEQNDAGNTALHWAALTGSIEAAKLLVAAGADAKIKNQAGHDSIYQAEAAGHEGLVEYLLQTVAFDDDNEEVSVTAGETGSSN